MLCDLRLFAFTGTCEGCTICMLCKLVLAHVALHIAVADITTQYDGFLGTPLIEKACSCTHHVATRDMIHVHAAHHVLLYRSVHGQLLPVVAGWDCIIAVNMCYTFSGQHVLACFAL
jgi:hypothetical protein